MNYLYRMLLHYPAYVQLDTVSEGVRLRWVLYPKGRRQSFHPLPSPPDFICWKPWPWDDNCCIWKVQSLSTTKFLLGGFESQEFRVLTGVRGELFYMLAGANVLATLPVAFDSHSQCDALANAEGLNDLFYPPLDVVLKGFYTFIAALASEHNFVCKRKSNQNHCRKDQKITVVLQVLSMVRGFCFADSIAVLYGAYYSL